MRWYSKVFLQNLAREMESDIDRDAKMEVRSWTDVIVN